MNNPDTFELFPRNKPEITLRSLTNATIDTVKLYRNGDVNPLGALVLVGMKAAFPERFSNTQLRNDPNLDFFNAVVWLGVEVNDAVDIIPQARMSQNQKVVEDIFGAWKKVLYISKGVAGDSIEKNQLLTNYQREILFLEKRVREMGDAQSLDGVRSYRQIMNAISIVHNAGALLGNAVLSPRLEVINKDNISWDTLRNKYDWITNGHPRNDVERKLCALYNLVMGIQVIDDYRDLTDDRRLGLHTIATELLKDDPPKTDAEERIKVDAEKYFHKAEEQGASQPA